MPAVRSYGSQLVDSCTGLPSARNSYAVRTHRSPSAMPSRAAISAGAGILASVRLSQSPCLPTAFMSARNGELSGCSRADERTTRTRRRGSAT